MRTVHLADEHFNGIVQIATISMQEGISTIEIEKLVEEELFTAWMYGDERLHIHVKEITHHSIVFEYYDLKGQRCLISPKSLSHLFKDGYKIPGVVV